jgi:biotin carboxylase
MRVLLLSTTTGYQLRSFGEAAERLGVELVLATDRCHHLEDPWRDGAIPVRFYDDDGSLAAIEAAARQTPIDGVIAVGDRPTTLAARVAAALGLPGNPVAAAEITRSKRAMRRAFTSARLEVPWFIDLPASADPRSIGTAIPYPCVVKPVGLSGGRGVIRADSSVQLGAAVASQERSPVRKAASSEESSQTFVPPC